MPEKTIGAITHGKIKEGLAGLLEDYEDEINKAYLVQDNELTISFSVKLSPHKTGATQVVSSMTFVESKIKDSVTAWADEQQKEIFPEDN